MEPPPGKRALSSGDFESSAASVWNKFLGKAPFRFGDAFNGFGQLYVRVFKCFMALFWSLRSIANKEVGGLLLAQLQLHRHWIPRPFRLGVGLKEWTTILWKSQSNPVQGSISVFIMLRITIGAATDAWNQRQCTMVQGETKTASSMAQIDVVLQRPSHELKLFCSIKRDSTVQVCKCDPVLHRYVHSQSEKTKALAKGASADMS